MVRSFVAKHLTVFLGKGGRLITRSSWREAISLTQTAVDRPL